MQKVVDLDQLKFLFKDGMTIMISGFMACGTPEKLIDLLVKMKVRDLTVICTDTSVVDRGIGRLIVNGQAKKVVASHIGTNPETGRRMNEGILDVELVPQGTLAERIRAGGYGLGGILTPTGVGTPVEENKQKIIIAEKEYLLELPLRADVALIKGSVVDEFGNTFYKGTTQNFNNVMAMAADTVVMEAEKLVKVGDIQQESVITPGIVVDYIVCGGE